jgi:DNA-directed RNA polymerase specialized sigma24 family protein
MTEARGASNAKAKRELGWPLRYPSWRQGFVEGLDPVSRGAQAAAFAIAYRMLGSVGEAEDVVQEALLRLHSAREAGERIESPRASLSTVVTRLAIDELRSARRRHPPEPGGTDDASLATAARRNRSASASRSGLHTWPARSISRLPE